MQSQCHFTNKGQQRCAGSFPLQTLDDLENATRKIPGKHMKISWLILSRVGIHYLSANFSNWTICPIHKKEFLDAWQVLLKVVFSKGLSATNFGPHARTLAPNIFPRTHLAHTCEFCLVTHHTHTRTLLFQENI